MTIPVVYESTLRVALEHKLAEYAHRTSRHGRRHGHDLKESTYKEFILRRVLSSRAGTDITSTVIACVDHFGRRDFHIEKFNKAWKVIEDYVRTGGQHNVNGTGIHRLPEPIGTHRV